jgi:hypothetical protein
MDTFVVLFLDVYSTNLTFDLFLKCLEREHVRPDATGTSVIIVLLGQIFDICLRDGKVPAKP